MANNPKRMQDPTEAAMSAIQEALNLREEPQAPAPQPAPAPPTAPPAADPFANIGAEVAAERDTTGLYAKAQTGGVINLTGVDSGYEDPEEPDIRLDMTELDVEAAADRVTALLTERGLLA